SPEGHGPGDRVGLGGADAVEERHQARAQLVRGDAGGRHPVAGLAQEVEADFALERPELPRIAAHQRDDVPLEEIRHPRDAEQADWRASTSSARARRGAAASATSRPSVTKPATASGADAASAAAARSALAAIRVAAVTRSSALSDSASTR